MRYLFITLKKYSVFSHSTLVSYVVTIDYVKIQQTLLTTISFIAPITTVIVTIATLRGGNAPLISTSEFFRRAAYVS